MDGRQLYRRNRPLQDFCRQKLEEVNGIFPLITQLLSGILSLDFRVATTFAIGQSVPNLILIVGKQEILGTGMMRDRAGQKGMRSLT